MCRRRILFTGFMARMEDTRLLKCVMFEEVVRGAGCVGGQEKEWAGCLLENLKAFGINADQWTTAAQDERERRKTAEHFMATWMASEKARAGLRHAVGCPNATGRTKDRVAQSERARLLAIVDWPEVARTCILRAVCRCHVVFLWRYVCFVLFRFRIFAFIESTTLRSIVLRSCTRVDSHTQLANKCFMCPILYIFCFFGDVVFSEYHAPLHSEYLVRFPFGVCFSIVPNIIPNIIPCLTTGWMYGCIKDMGVSENRVNQSINQSINQIYAGTFNMHTSYQ